MFRFGTHHLLGRAATTSRTWISAPGRQLVRMESSSSSSSQPAGIPAAAKKKLAMLEQQRQSELLSQRQQQQKQQKQQQLHTTKTKKGFSSVTKVPSTISLKPKDLLLDNLFQGYRPLTLPISRPRSAGKRQPPRVVYFELDDNMNLVNDDFGELSGEAPHGSIRDKNLTRYQYSNYSFSKDQRLDEDVEDDLSGPGDMSMKSKLGNKFSESYRLRKTNGGRRRLQYVHRGKIKDGK